MTSINITPSPLFDYSFKEETKVLGITSHGGAGHLQLMKGIAEKIKKNNVEYVQADALQDTLPKWLSYYCIKDWNEAKAAGDIEAQEQLVKGTILWIPRHQLADFLFFLPIFLWTVRKLYKDPSITHIVDTQPIGTKAFIRAARLINWMFERKIKVTKVSTEIATEYVCSFADPAKTLSDKDKAIFKLAGPSPFKQGADEKDEEFIRRQNEWWKEHFGLTLDQICYSTYPIREPFQPYIDNDQRHTIKSITITINNEEERFDPLTTDDSHTFNIEDDDLIGMISIGSQVTREATIAYVQGIINAAKDNPDSPKKIKLFVATGKHEPGTNSLYKELKEKIDSQKESFASNLEIIPMGMQSADTFAPLMHRADFGVFGSGGMTTMELSATAKGQIFLHSEANKLKSKNPDVKPEEGFALWEKGNALHLVDKKNAKIIVPDETFAPQITTLLQRKN